MTEQTKVPAPTPLDEARQLIQEHQQQRVEAVRAGIKALLEKHRCQLVPMPGQAMMDRERNIVIPAGTVEVIALP